MANVFDAVGDRVAQRVSAGAGATKTTSYLVDETAPYAVVVEERAPDVNDAGASQLQARYVCGNGLAPLAIWRKGSDGAVKLFYFVSDGQESVRQLTSASGAVTDSYFYDAWGNGLAGGSGATVNPFRYTGQQLDPDGKYFLRARFYNPATGRFLGHDPLLGSAGDPVSMHRYLYGGADGVNYNDPSGLQAGDMSLGGLSVRLGLDGLFNGISLPVITLPQLSVGQQIALAASVVVAGLFADVAFGGRKDEEDEEETGNRIALGLGGPGDQYLTSFAEHTQAQTYQQWGWEMADFLRVVSDTNSKVFVSLRGMIDESDGSDNPTSGLFYLIRQGRKAASRMDKNSRYNGVTAWEMYEIFIHPNWWPRVKWYEWTDEQGYYEVNNPIADYGELLR